MGKEGSEVITGMEMIYGKGEKFHEINTYSFIHFQTHRTSSNNNRSCWYVKIQL